MVFIRLRLKSVNVACRMQSVWAIVLLIRHKPIIMRKGSEMQSANVVFHARSCLSPPKYGYQMPVMTKQRLPSMSPYVSCRAIMSTSCWFISHSVITMALTAQWKKRTRQEKFALSASATSIRTASWTLQSFVRLLLLSIRWKHMSSTSKWSYRK